MGETASGRTGVSFTTEFIAVLYVTCLSLRDFCNGGSFVFQARGRHVVLYGLQSFRSDVTNVSTRHTTCCSNIHYSGVAIK
jgi:hypothetical protein